MTKPRIVSDPSELEGLEFHWEALAEGARDGIEGLGVMASFDWVRTIWSTHFGGTPQPIVVLEEGGEVTGVLPLARQRVTARGLSWTQLVSMGDAYPGRGGLLVRGADPARLRGMFEFLLDAVPSWDTLRLVVVGGSGSERLLVRALEGSGLDVDVVPGPESPYVALASSFDEFAETLDKKFRYNLRSRERKLLDQGAQFVPYTEESAVERFLECVVAVEQQSWKESAGTSLTRNPEQERFHRLIGATAARNGWLGGHVLELAGVPIAYDYLVVYGNVCYELKSSMDDRYRTLSPGIVLTAMGMREMCTRGARVWDFIGDPQSHKARWGRTRYSRRIFTVYRRTLGGIQARLLRVASRVKDRFAGLRAFRNAGDDTATGDGE